jgi:hypothetical protein
MKMKKINKMLIQVMLLFTILLVSNVSQALNTVNINDDEQIKKIDTSYRKVRVYRFGPSGSITSKYIFVKDGDDLSERLAEKCQELTINDDKIQSYIKKVNSNMSNFKFLSNVKSSGKGLNFKTNSFYSKKVTIRPHWDKDFPFRFYFTIHERTKFNLFKSVFCFYSNEEANTTITPLTSENSSVIHLEGPHMILTSGFIGYTTWIGRFPVSPFRLLPRAFAGFALFTAYYKL